MTVINILIVKQLFIVQVLSIMGRGKAIDEKIRLIIINLHKSGKSNGEIGKLLSLSRYSVRNIIKLYNSNGSAAQKPRYVKKSKLTDADRRALARIVKSNRRANYGELSVLWSEAVGRRVCRSTCHSEARKLGFGTYKVSLMSSILRGKR